MAKKFQNLTIDMTKVVDKMPVGDRLAMLQSDSGRKLLSSLSPSQLSDMFPDYYKKAYPDVGKILKSISDPSFKGRQYTVEEAQRFMDIDRRRVGGGERISYKNTEATPSWARKLQEETGVTFSKPGAKARLSNEKKQLLEEMSRGNISADDPRVAFLKDMSEQDLQKAGIKKEVDANGNVSYGIVQTAAALMTDVEIADKLRSEAATGFSPRERATLDFIAKREGSANPNIIYGDTGGVPGSGWVSRELGLDKRPLEDHSVAEVLDLQKKMTRLTAAKGVAGGQGTSAVGTGQMVRSTLLANLRALGIPEEEWPNIKFDKNLQERLTLSNFKLHGIGDPNADPSSWNMDRLGAQYESVDVRKGFKGMTDVEKQKIAQASPTKPIPGDINISQESIVAKRKELDQQDIQKRQAFLAERTAPKIPDGLSPQVIKDIETIGKTSPGRKQDIVEMIAKAGNGDVRKGVERVNELQRQNPTYVKEVIQSGNDFASATPAPRQESTESTQQPDQTAQPTQQRISSYTPAEQTLVDRISVNADGGTENVNADQIKAMPIDSLKGDNSVVMDQDNKPLFTMNTKEEQAVYNPKTKQVDVQPVTKTDPNSLGAVEKQNADSTNATKDTTAPDMRPPMNLPEQMPSTYPRSGETSVKITDDIFKDPSFKRAIGKTRFVDTGDAALGGHFGSSNADLA